MAERNRWQFAPGAAERFPDGDPERLLAAAVTVKSNPVRRVAKSGEFFFKIDRRPGRSFRREFAAGRLLASLGVPVVPHLACGRLAAGEAVLVTEALAGAVDARSRLETTRGGRAEAEALARLVRSMWELGLYHGDCHLGNFLFAAGSTEPVLVDVAAVRRRRGLDRFRRGRMLRLVTEMRNYFGDGALTELLALAGARDPGAFLEKSLRREAAALRHEWPKRRSQILTGYAKFTRVDGEMLLDAAERETPDRLPEEHGDRAALEKRFLLHYYLRLAEIPHRGIAALDRAAGTIRISGIEGNALGDAELVHRLELCGLDVPMEARRGGAVDELRAEFSPSWL